MTNSNDSNMEQEYRRCRSLVDKRLSEFFISDVNYAVLLEAMRYSLLAGGKRIRAVICMKFCQAVGDASREKALDAACAIEMLHTYSLIHDDFPCMDDDDMRRGKPSSHIAFGEATAMLAGDALQAAAFEALLGSALPSHVVAPMALILAQAAGPHGICAGQYLDLSSEGKNLGSVELEEIHRLKTAALISASAQIGVLAGGGSQGQIEAAGMYANSVGLAFQIRDDLLDSISTTKEFGKTVGSDNKKNKTTFATLYSISECEDIIRLETERAIGALQGIFSNTEFLTWLARILAFRKN